MQQVFTAVVGVLLLTLGWRLFWMFVGLVGFVAGLQTAQSLWGQQPFWMLWAAGLVCGCFGAILALFLQHLAVAIGGFVAGGILALQLAAISGYSVNGLIALVRKRQLERSPLGSSSETTSTSIFSVTRKVKNRLSSIPRLSPGIFTRHW